MKKILLLLGIIVFPFIGYAQVIQRSFSPEKEDAWYNLSKERDGIYGAAVEEAHTYIKNRKIKKRPIVALIGGGIDIEHEGLRENIWQNRKEKPNGLDDDRNGYVDDINGWNFLGGKDGKVVDNTRSEGDREFLRLKSLYADYIYNEGKFYLFNGEKMEEAPSPKNMVEYQYYQNQILPESELASLYGGIVFSRIVREYGEELNRQLKKEFPGRKITQKEFLTLYTPSIQKDSLNNISFALITYGFSIYKTDSWDVVYNNFILNTVQEAQQRYETAYQRGVAERRLIVGDDPYDVGDTKYGNGVLMTWNSSEPGTMQAGIIAAKRKNGSGINGISDALIMPLVVEGSRGEPYLKDIALSIRYAVDHGADIIVLPKQNTLYPPLQRKWVEDALLYSEKKGVLVIVPVWELSHDLSKVSYYPNREMIEGEELSNLMLVGPSDRSGNPSRESNYSSKELDLFAPGIEIGTTRPGDIYGTGSSSNLAAATVAGVAALVKSYYPHLNGAQLRSLLNKSVTYRERKDLSLSGGIINALQALREAEKIKK